MKTDMEDRFADGQIKLMDGDYEGSIAIFSEIVAADNSCSRAYQARAIAHLKSGQMDLALEDIEQAISCDMENHRLHYHKAGILVQQHELDAALESICRAIELAPEYAPSYFLRGKIYEDLGNEELSAADFSKSINLRKQQTDVVDF